MKAEKLAADIFESAQKNEVELTEEAKTEITETCELYIELTEMKDATAESIAEATEALKAVVSNWSWDGAISVEQSFWRKAIDVAMPIGKELLIMAVNQALHQASQKIL